MKHESKYIHAAFETQGKRNRGISGPNQIICTTNFLRYSPDTINAHARTCQPHANADEGYYGNEEHPEPEEHVDLLVVPAE